MMKPIDPYKAAAKDAGLRYVSDDIPGITRKKSGKIFTYINENGKAIKNKKIIERLNALAIPPAYTDVWICPFENGHIQATGRDARGRKQYRYHEKWNATRDSSKYDKMISFGFALPKIRRTAKKHLNLKGLPKEKVLATIVQLLDKTHIRVGNESYAQENKSFGLTTMRVKHVAIHGANVEFVFTGKSGVKHDVELNDKRLAKIIKQCHDLPGYKLFQYIDDSGEQRSIHSEDVNTYLKEISGDDFTAKDFRTWHGSVCACTELGKLQPCTSKAEAKREINAIIEQVAKNLGNTKAVSRKAYVHPQIIESYSDGLLLSVLDKVNKKPAKKLQALKSEEIQLMHFLQSL